MLDGYVASMEAAIRDCVTVATYSLNTVHLSPCTGYVKGEILFVDGSHLTFFEFLLQRPAGLLRDKYRYHFMDADCRLVFRYDNAPHHSTVATFPHHRHRPSDVTVSSAPSFTEVLVEAQEHVLGM